MYAKRIVSHPRGIFRKPFRRIAGGRIHVADRIHAKKAHSPLRAPLESEMSVSCNHPPELTGPAIAGRAHLREIQCRAGDDSGGGRQLGPRVFFSRDGD